MAPKSRWLPVAGWFSSEQTSFSKPLTAAGLGLILNCGLPVLYIRGPDTPVVHRRRRQLLQLSGTDTCVTAMRSGQCWRDAVMTNPQGSSKFKPPVTVKQTRESRLFAPTCRQTRMVGLRSQYIHISHKPSNTSTKACTHTDMPPAHIHTYIHTCTHADIHTYIRTCVHTYRGVYIQTRANIYMYMY